MVDDLPFPFQIKKKNTHNDKIPSIMALLKQIDNLGATVCWCPFKESKSILAVGTKGSMSFDDDKGELCLFDVSSAR